MCNLIYRRHSVQCIQFYKTPLCQIIKVGTLTQTPLQRWTCSRTYVKQLTWLPYYSPQLPCEASTVLIQPILQRKVQALYYYRTYILNLSYLNYNMNDLIMLLTLKKKPIMSPYNYRTNMLYHFQTIIPHLSCRNISKQVFCLAAFPQYTSLSLLFSKSLFFHSMKMFYLTFNENVNTWVIIFS